MKFESANPSAVQQQNRLTYYVVITGKSNGAIGYMWFADKRQVKLWTCVGDYENILAVQHDGVNFSVYDEMPFTPNVRLADIFDEIIVTEGLR